MRRIYLLLLVLPLLSGCGKEKKGELKPVKKTTPKTVNYKDKKEVVKVQEGYEKKDEKNKLFDEDVDAFVLEEDSDFDLFSDEKGATLSQNEEGKFEIKESGDDTDFSWIEDNKSDKFKTVYFGFDKHALQEDQKEVLAQNIAKVKETLQKDKNAIVVCEGHTCLYGAAAYNLGLSEKRSKFVGEILASNGIPREKIKEVGRGKEMAVVLGGSKEEQSPNRRVELFTVTA